MDTPSASQILDDVYTSSLEIIKKKQRHLYRSTLELLARTCKTSSGVASKKFDNDQILCFWLADVLPLLFDDDVGIQNGAVAAVEQAVAQLTPQEMHACSAWPQLKNQIADVYPALMHKLLDQFNPYWHRILSLLLEIYDTEFLANSNITNTYLKVLEAAIRSPETEVKNQALICWRTVVKIFTIEPIVSKRLSLLVLPLKSITPKDEYSARLKLDVWWYVLARAHQHIGNHFENLLKSFVMYIGGNCSHPRKPNILAAYPGLRKTAIPCAALLLSIEPDDALDSILLEQNLAAFPQPSPLMKAVVFRKHFELLFQMANECYNYLFLSESTGTATCAEKLLLQSLLRNLTQAMMRFDITPYTDRFCEELKRLLPEHGPAMQAVAEALSAEDEPLQRDVSSDDEFRKSIGRVYDVCLQLRRIAPRQSLQRCVSNILASATDVVETEAEFRFLIELYTLLTSDDYSVGDDYSAFELQMLVWEVLSLATNAYLRSNSLAYRVKRHAKLIDQWLLWPLKTCSAYMGMRGGGQIFTPTICDIWAQLLAAGQNSNDRIDCLLAVRQALQELFKHRKSEEPCIALLCDAYATAAQRTSPAIKEIFILFKETLDLAHLTAETQETCLSRLRVFIVDLTNDQLAANFDIMKLTLATAVKCLQSRKSSAAFIEEWKRLIVERLRMQYNKSFISQVRDLFKGKETFVIIPSVWSLKPDKLTDRQKERMTEKGNIPALYNDMSRSEDASSIKPWTPKKVVLAKDGSNEIAIGNESLLNTNNYETPPKRARLEITTTPTAGSPKTENSDAQNSVASTPKSKKVASVDCEDTPSSPKTGATAPSVGKRARSSSPAEPADGGQQSSSIRRSRKGIARKRLLQDSELPNAKRQTRSTPVAAVQSTTTRRAARAKTQETPSTPQSKGGETRRNKGGETPRSKGAETPRSKNGETPRNKSGETPRSNGAETPTGRKTPKLKTELVTADPINEPEPAQEELTKLSSEVAKINERSSVSPPRCISPITPASTPVKKNSTRHSPAKKVKTTPPTDAVFKKPSKSPPSPTKKISPATSPSLSPEGIPSTKPAAQQNASTPPLTPTKRTSPRLASWSPSTAAATTLNSTNIMTPLMAPAEQQQLLTESAESTPAENATASSIPPVHSPSSSPEIKTSTNSSDSLVEEKLPNGLFIEAAIIQPVVQEEQQPAVEEFSTECETQATDSQESDQSTDVGNQATTTNITDQRAEQCTDLPQESSPKKETIKTTAQQPASPAQGRKRPNSLLSPTIRARSTPQMTGRGAQFINMIRKGNLFAAAVSTPPSRKSIGRLVAQANSTPMQSSPNLLVFSKTMPSLDASPSVSILKRKIAVDCTPDDASKRSKRVSFHDPPVSATKEYIRDETPAKRSILSDQAGDGSESKNSLRRHNRFALDSKRISLLQKQLKMNAPAPASDAEGEVGSVKANEVELSAFDKAAPESVESPPPIDAKSALELVVEQCSLEEVLARYFARADEQTELPRRANELTKFLSQQMAQNERIKTHTLETLSEAHSKEFLDHAIGENLSSVVCERLGVPSVLKYVFEKSQVNGLCRTTLLAEIPAVLSNCKAEQERLDFVRTLFESAALNNEQILDLIGLLAQLRHKNASSNADAEMPPDLRTT